MSSEASQSEYLLLFRGTEWHHALAPEEIRERVARFAQWAEGLQKSGTFKVGRPLFHRGKIVQGNQTVIDGPFAESKEAIAGLIIIEAASFEDAVEIAKACPGLQYGLTVEVRPVSSEPGELELAREKERASKAAK
jgi:hypothetical protein